MTNRGRALRHVLVTLYLASLLVSASVYSASYLIEPGGYLDDLGDIAFWASPLFLVIAFLGVLLPPTRNSLFRAALLICAWPAMLALSTVVRPYGRDLFFRTRQADFQALADASLKSMRIRSIWNLHDGYRLLNRRLVAVPLNSRSDSLWGKPLEPLRDVLRSEGITSDEYEAFSRQLRALHVTILDVDSSQVVLGGRDAGFVYLDDTGSGWQVGDSLGNSRVTRRFTDRWYYAVW
jgi:hypothetical protein